MWPFLTPWHLSPSDGVLGNNPLVQSTGEVRSFSAIFDRTRVKVNLVVQDNA